MKEQTKIIARFAVPSATEADSYAVQTARRLPERGPPPPAAAAAAAE